MPRPKEYEPAAAGSRAAPSHEATSEKQSNEAIRTHDDDEPLASSYFTQGAPSQDSTAKRLPPWLDHFNAKDLKTLFKSSLAVWIQMILIFIAPTLKVMGSAAFVGW